MAVVYTLETAINSFFEAETTATRQQCDEFALARGGPPVTSVQIQGAFSYAVVVGADKVFQFRLPSSSIDLDLLHLATATHGTLVPACKYYGTVGGSRPLCIYEMNKLPGVPYILARDTTIPQPLDSIARQRRTVTDMARFFAQAWNNPQHLPTDKTAALCSEFEAAFARLAQSLPSRFRPVLGRVRQDLTSLFSEDSKTPLVLSHGDLCEMNLLVDADTGSLTGVIDWVEARILPFGFSLYGVENLLGYMDAEGWHYYGNAQELRELFWRVFSEDVGGNISEATLQTIWTARMAGLFYRYGFIVDGKEILGVVGPESGSLRYLDAFCTPEGWVPVALSRS
jgi:hypothetical protein